MSPIARYHNILTNIDADVTRAERLLADALADVATRQENRQGVCDFEKRVRDIRFELENLWTLRRQHVGQVIERHGYLTPNQFRPQLQPIAPAYDAVSQKLRACYPPI